VGAPSIVATALVVILGLPLRVVAVDVHGEMQLRMDRLQSGSCRFVRCRNRLGVPVGPVDGVFEDGQGERVRQPFADHFPPIAPIEERGFDHVVLGIRPVDPAGGVVQGETVGPEDRLVDDAPAVAPVHLGSLDLGVGAPVGPEDQSFTGMDGDGAGFVDVVCCDDRSLFAVKTGDFDASGAGVGPEDQVVDPVESDSAGGLQTPLDDVYKEKNARGV
jgi:hypothetical protein